jgi:hypothetical protein
MMEQTIQTMSVVNLNQTESINKMNVRKWIAVSVILGAIAAQTSATADDNTVSQTIITNQVTTTDQVTTTEQSTTTNQVITTERATTHKVYHANQLSLEAFGTYATRNREGSSGNEGGGGLGLTYFFTRYVGIGADTYVEEWKLPYRVNGSLILRLPLPDRFSKLAVYGFGGGGREFKDIPQFTWHGGGGLEYKFCSHLGIFADAREVFPDKTPNYTLVRSGLSFGF